jgi:hypothetical protein
MPQVYDITNLAAPFEQLGNPYRFIPAGSRESPIDQLLIAMETGDPEHTFNLEICLLPEGVDPPVLQLFILLPFSFQPPCIPDLCRLIVHINNELPLLGFGLLEDPSFVFFRHLLPFNPESLDPEFVVSLALQMTFSIECFFEVLEGIASGRINYNEAITDLEEVLSYLHEIAEDS